MLCDGNSLPETSLSPELNSGADLVYPDLSWTDVDLIKKVEGSAILLTGELSIIMQEPQFQHIRILSKMTPAFRFSILLWQHLWPRILHLSTAV